LTETVDYLLDPFQTSKARLGDRALNAIRLTCYAACVIETVQLRDYR